MGQQHTAKEHGKPSFESYKNAKSAKKAGGNKVTKNRGPASKAKKVFVVGSGLVDQQVHLRYCTCVSCKIKKGNQENADRIARVTGYRPYY